MYVLDQYLYIKSQLTVCWFKIFVSFIWRYRKAAMLQVLMLPLTSSLEKTSLVPGQIQ